MVHCLCSSVRSIESSISQPFSLLKLIHCIRAWKDRLLSIKDGFKQHKVSTSLCYGITQIPIHANSEALVCSCAKPRIRRPPLRNRQGIECTSSWHVCNESLFGRCSRHKVSFRESHMEITFLRQIREQHKSPVSHSSEKGELTRTRIQRGSVAVSDGDHEG